MSNSCGKYAMVNIKTGSIWPALCGCRSCERKECRELYASRRIAQVQGVVVTNALNRFITLTVDPKNFTSDKDAWEKIPHVWLKLRKRLCRAFPGIKFIMLLEKHKKNNRPHIHGFLNRYIPVEWLWKNWEECGGGHNGYMELIKGNFEEVSRYVGKELSVYKYVGKDCINIGNYVKRKQRIMWKSVGLKGGDNQPNLDVVLIKDVKIYDGNGNFVLPDAEVQLIIDSVSKPDQGKEAWHEKRFTWENVERACTGGNEESSKELASCGRQQEGKSKGEQAESTESEDKRRDQEAFGQVKEYLCQCVQEDTKVYVHLGR